MRKTTTFSLKALSGQTVLPGAEEATQATMAQRGSDKPMQAKKAQKPCDFGLFSDEKDQVSLF